MGPSLRQRSRHHRQDDPPQRRSPRSDRHRQSFVRSRGGRAASRALGTVSARSQHGRSRSLLPVSGPSQARRVPRAGASAAQTLRRGIHREVPERARRRRRFQSRAHADGVCQGRQAYAAHSQRCRRLRAAHCLRQRREPAVGARHGAQARSRPASRYRRRSRAHRQADAHRERDAVVDGWHPRTRARRAWHPRAVVDQHSRNASHRSGRRARRARLARAAVHRGPLDRHRDPVRTAARAAKLANRSHDGAERQHRTLGRDAASQQGALDARRCRSGAGAAAARGVGAVDSDAGQPARRRSPDTTRQTS